MENVDIRVWQRIGHGRIGCARAMTDLQGVHRMCTHFRRRRRYMRRHRTNLKMESFFMPYIEI